MILNVTHLAKDGEIFILKMPSIRIEDLAKGMLEVYKKKFPNNKIVKQIKILKSRERERFHELLITQDEIPYCHDVGIMYKISNKETKKLISMNEFSSETSKRISKEKLHKTINELIDEYLNDNLEQLFADPGLRYKFHECNICTKKKKRIEDIINQEYEYY